MQQLSLLIVAAGSHNTAELWYAPDFAAGDAEFLEQDPTRPVQLRPILASERRPGRFFGPSDRMLVYCGEYEFRAFVRLKPGQRANTPQNVKRAIAQVERIDPTAARAFRRAASGLPLDQADERAGLFDQMRIRA
jgi:hypothetical protein